MELRPELLAFAEAMEAKLRENDHKGGWQDESRNYLMERLVEEAQELQEELDEVYLNRDRIRDEAADVANFALMLFDLHLAEPAPAPSAAPGTAAAEGARGEG